MFSFSVSHSASGNSEHLLWAMCCLFEEFLSTGFRLHMLNPSLVFFNHWFKNEITSYYSLELLCLPHIYFDAWLLGKPLRMDPFCKYWPPRVPHCGRLRGCISEPGGLLPACWANILAQRRLLAVLIWSIPHCLLVPRSLASLRSFYCAKTTTPWRPSPRLVFSRTDLLDLLAAVDKAYWPLQDPHQLWPVWHCVLSSVLPVPPLPAFSSPRTHSVTTPSSSPQRQPAPPGLLDLHCQPLCQAEHTTSLSPTTPGFSLSPDSPSSSAKLSPHPWHRPLPSVWRLEISSLCLS